MGRSNSSLGTIAVQLNARAAALCDRLIEDGDALRIAVSTAASGCRLVDCGIAAEGGLEVGGRLAEICLAGLGRVSLAPAPAESAGAASVAVFTDHPLAACMASQYAGWQIARGKYSAMGSGPMRAAGSKEPLFDKIGMREKPQRAVGVLEARALPPDDVCRDLARECGVAPDMLTLLAAPTASLAGMVQVVARSVETALHKLFESGFDLSRVKNGMGAAPLPPSALDDLAAIGRTNDAILYGGEVTLWVRGDDASLQAIGPQVPSCASSDFGQPFAAIFERYNRDFYAIDPHLFSPAVVTFANLDTGRAFRFGRLRPDVIARSFAIEVVATPPPHLAP
jgi:methenyltetrahydromethanopterin cyclohydrolase